MECTCLCEAVRVEGRPSSAVAGAGADRCPQCSAHPTPSEPHSTLHILCHTPLLYQLLAAVVHFTAAVDSGSQYTSHGVHRTAEWISSPLHRRCPGLTSDPSTSPLHSHVHRSTRGNTGPAPPLTFSVLLCPTGSLFSSSLSSFSPFRRLAPLFPSSRQRLPHCRLPRPAGAAPADHGRPADSTAASTSLLVRPRCGGADRPPGPLPLRSPPPRSAQLPSLPV